MRNFFKPNHNKPKTVVRAESATPEDNPHCLCFFRRVKRISDHLSTDYFDISQWLKHLANSIPCKKEANRLVLDSAIYVAKRFAEKDKTTNRESIQNLKQTIEAIGQEFDLNDNNEHDYIELVQYCIKYNIEIPKVIRDVINDAPEWGQPLRFR